MAIPSENDLHEQGRAELLRIRPDLVCLPGDASELAIAYSVAMATVVLAKVMEAVAATYLDGNKGEELKKLVRDHWSIEPVADVQAVGVARFTHVAGPAGTIAAGTRIATDPDQNGDFVTATTDLPLIYGAGDAQLEVAATVVGAGPSGNVAPGAFTRILDSLFDPTFVVTNVERFAGGNPAWTDEEIAAAARGKDRTQRRGTAEAVEYGAKQVPTIRVATAVEDEQTGLGTVYVGDSDGQVNAELVNDSIIELEGWRALGAVVQVTGGVRLLQAIDVSLTVRAGVSIATLVELVRSAIVSAVNRLVPGEILYHDLIKAAAKAVDPDGIVAVTVNDPPANLAPAANEVIRTSSGIVTVGG